MPAQKISADPELVAPTQQARLPAIDPGTNSTLNYKMTPAAIKLLLQTGATDLSATGTASSTTYLRGDNTWATPAGGGGGEDVAGYEVATPHLMRGTVNAALYSGVNKGVLGSSAARISNLTALNAAVAYAVTNRKFFEIEPGEYEIEGTGGLVIPQSKNTGFVWKGTKGSHIKQFSDNAPVVTIGSVTTGPLTEQIVVDGFRASYNANQASFALSTAVRLGAIRNSRIGNLNVYADYPALGFTAASGVKAYRGIVMQHDTDPLSFFSNTVHDIHVGGCQMNMVSFGWDVNNDGSDIRGGGGTGNVFSNWYLSQGVTNNQQDIAGYVLRIRGEGDLYESVFEQINIEWCKALYLVFAEIVKNAVFNSIHFEGNQISGADGSIFNVSGSQININGINLLDQTVHSAPSSAGASTGVASVFRTYGDCAIGGAGLAYHWSSTDRVNRAWQLMAVTGFTPWDAANACNITNITTRDASGGNQHSFVTLADTMPTSAFPGPAKVDQFRWHAVLPDALGTHLKLNTDATMYGSFRDPIITYPAVLGATRTLRLSANMKASGSLATMPVRAGSIITVRRGTGDGGGTADGFNLVVRDVTAADAIRATISAAGTQNMFRFDGASWLLVT